MNLNRGLGAVLLLIGCFFDSPGQESRPPAEQSRPPAQGKAQHDTAPRVLVSSEEDYRIGPRDVIEIQIEDATELSGTFNVSASGTFLMPYLGRMKAEKKTPEELARIIADGLRVRYLKDPRVTVAVKQYNSRSFFIQGAVRDPGVYQIESGASLLKLIIMAGGLLDHHGSSAFIIRETKPAQRETPSDEASEPKYEMIQANINGLMKGHFDQNVSIQPGDIINIPSTDMFFVAGEVQAPGSFPLKPGTTVRQAISLARGFTFSAAKGRSLIFREEAETGSRKEIKVDLGEVMSGKQDDIPLLANDIIIVPNSRLKSVGGAILNAFGTNVVTRGVRY